VDLAVRVEEKKFREDLFYRLNVINIALPPLRERRDDISMLAWHFVERFGSNRLPPIRGITPEAMLLLHAYAWPGNVRELQNAIERAVALAEGEYLDVCDFPERITRSTRLPMAEGEESWDLLTVRKSIVRGFERDYVIRLLKENNGNVSAAARQAGINRRTLYRLMERYSIGLEELR